MKLFYSPFSPFARKCRIVVIEKGLEQKVELVSVNTLDNPPELLAVNPAGTVPALQLDNGQALCESPVICEYLDSLSPQSPLFPSDPLKRFDVLGLAALADQMMAAAVVCVVEGRRPAENRSKEWVERKEKAVERIIANIAQRPWDSNAALTIGLINTVVALKYVDFRLPHVKGYKTYSPLAAWYETVAQLPSFAATAP